MRKSLSLKVGIVIVFISCILFSLFIYINIKNEKARLTESFIQEAKATVYSLNVNINQKDDINNLTASIQKSMWLNPEIINIKFNFLNIDKIITVASSNPNDVNKEVDEDNLKSFTDNQLINKIVPNGDSQILKIINPIYISGQRVGTTQTDFTLQRVDNKMKIVKRTLIIEYIIMMFLFILSIYLLLKYLILKPISKIIIGIKEIAKNNYDYKVKIKSQDEIGELANAFNQTSNELKKSKDEISEYTNKLEKEVEERTIELKKGNLDLEKIVYERTADLEKIKLNLEGIVSERTNDLNKKLEEAKNINSIMMNREFKMIELKKQIEELKKA